MAKPRVRIRWFGVALGLLTIASLVRFYPLSSSQRIQGFEQVAYSCLEADQLRPYAKNGLEFVVSSQATNLLCAQASTAYFGLTEHEKQRVDEGLIISFMLSGLLSAPRVSLTLDEQAEIRQLYYELRPVLLERMKSHKQPFGTRQVVGSFFQAKSPGGRQIANV